MSDIARKLVTIERIQELTPHSNADTLEIARIRGWNVIVKKDTYKVGEYVCYFEIDSFVPVEERYEFLRKNCFRSTKNLGDGFRIRTMKLRGEVSQGLILPLCQFPELDGLLTIAPLDENFVFEGHDVTADLNVQKYEKPIPSNLAGTVRGNFPSFIPKTDEERLQNVIGSRSFYEHEDDTFEMTVKMDGSSMTVYWNNGEFGVCSRNMDLLETEENTFWQVANKLKLRNLLKKILPYNLALQGELVGPGIQGNPHGFKEHRFFVFNIYSIDEKKYLSSRDRKQLINDFKYAFEEPFDIDHVKSLGTLNTIPSVQYAEEICNELAPGMEGIVFKSWNDPSFSFKMINPTYLLKHDE